LTLPRIALLVAARAAALAAAIAASLAVSLALPTRTASAQTASITVDRTVVRFYAAETGGAAYPRYIFERTLAFEARLEALALAPQGIGDGYQEHDVRAALEHHVAEEILATLADRLIADSPPSRRPTAEELARVEQDVMAAMFERLGGRARVDDAAKAEQLDTQEVEAVFRRGALAAWYVDRAITPILHPSEEQLRDVYRTSAHPYRGRPLEEVRAPLERWFGVERARVAEGAFLQAARSRVKIIAAR
jgi:hypothetical protein